MRVWQPPWPFNIGRSAAQARAQAQEKAARARRHQALADVSHLALTETDVQTILENVVRLVARGLDCSHASLMEWEKETETFSVRARVGWDEDGPGPKIRVADGSQAAYTLQNPGVVRMDEARTETRFLVHPVLRQVGVRSALSVLIATENAPYGMISAFSTRPRFFQDEDLPFFQSVANIVAVALEKNKLAQERRLSDERFRSFFEESTEAIWRFDLVPPWPLGGTCEEFLEAAYNCGRLTECNEAFARLYGHTVEELLGARLDDLLVRTDPQNDAMLTAFCESGFRLENVESLEKDRHGNELEFSNTMLGIVENGHLVCAWGTQRDITLQKRATANLTASEVRFRTLLDGSPFAIGLVREGRYLYVNRAHAALFGAALPDYFVGLGIADFLDPACEEGDTAPQAEPGSLPAATRGYDGRATRLDGSHFEFHLDTAAISLPDGPARVFFLFDVSRERSAERERAALLARERAAARRAHRLQEITAALAGALTIEAVAEIIVDRGVSAAHAWAGALTLPAPGQNPENATELHVFRATGYSANTLGRHATLSISEPLPICRAFREGRPCWLGTIEEAAAAFPDLADIALSSRTKAMAALPLLVESRVLGVLSLSFPTTQSFDEEELAFMLTLSGQCAQALERVRLLTEARESARRHHESLALLNTLLDTSPVGFGFLDSSGHYVLVNETLGHMGLTSEAHTGKSLEELLAPGDRRLLDMLHGVLRDGVPSGEEVLVRPGATPQASARHWLCSFFPVRTPEGQLLGAGQVVVDITDRVRAEAERMQLLDELETERSRFEAILRQMPSAVLIAEAGEPGNSASAPSGCSGRIILSNHQVEQIWRPQGAMADTLEGFAAYPGFFPDGTPLQPADWPLSRAVCQGEVITGEEIVVRRGDNSMAVIRANATPIKDREGHIAAGVVVFEDITERARQDRSQRFLAETASALLGFLDERELASRLAQLCVPRLADWCAIALLDESQDATAIALSHADHEPEHLAAQLKTLLAQDSAAPWDIAGALERSSARLYTQNPGQGTRNASPAWQQLVAELQPGSVVLAPLTARGRVVGLLLWLNSSSKRAHDEADCALAEELGRRVGTMVDNARLYAESQTARRQAESAVAQARLARDEAQSANRAKDEFLAVVSHELRTPLTPIMGWIELLRDASATEGIRSHAYDVIERNARSQAQLINDILDVSRITTGKLRLDVKPEPLCEIIERAVDAIRTSLTGKNITLDTQIEDVGLVHADAGRLQQVVWNLLQNAGKFTPEGGTVRLSLLSEGLDAVLRVQDNGIGIGQDFLPHVFEQFRQADSSPTRPAGGLGLGLAIVRHITEMHGGTVQVESAGAGQGATFTVRLPLLSAPELAAPTAPQGVPSLSNGQAHLGRAVTSGELQAVQVLLVEDDMDTRNTLARMLERSGAEVRTAESGARALEEVEQWTPHVIVSDIGMASMDGYQLRGILRDRLPQVPALALTAYAAPSDERRAREAGFEAYQTKPVDRDLLVEKLRRILGQKPGK